MIVTRRIGGLNCTLVGSERDLVPELLCILCHGFGAPGNDLVPLGMEYLEQEPALQGRVLFVFPEAPLSLASQGLFDGRAWWRIDMLKLQRAVEFGELRDLRKDVPDGLAESRDQLMNLIDDLKTGIGFTSSQLVLGGFSQGSMLATDVALRLAEKPAGLIVYSGTLLNENEWRPMASSCAGMRVLQSHGRRDPLLPFALAEELRDMLQGAGAEIEFHAFAGMHTIPLTAMQATTRFLKTLLNSR